MSSAINKHKSDKNLEIAPTINSKKKTIDLIKEYLSSQPDQIKKLEKVSQTLFEVINNFIEITQNYSNQLELLALKIIPNYTIEGQLAQAVQGNLLFYSEGLNTLIKELKRQNIKRKENDVDNIINSFNEYKSSYFNKIRAAILNSEKYKKEIFLYEEYLVNKQYNEHKRCVDEKNIDDEIIVKNKEKNNKENKVNNIKNEENKNDKNNSDGENRINKINNKDEIDLFKNYDPFNDNILSEVDNKKEVIKSHNLFISTVKESNDILNNIKKFLSVEKTNLRENIFKISDCLIEGLLKCANMQKDNYEIQYDVIKNLIKKLKFEETDSNQIKPAPVKLKFLEIYKNYIEEKNNTKKTNLTTDNLNIGKKNFSNLSRKTYKLSQKNINMNALSRNTISFNQINNKSNKELVLEQLKSLVIKLDREEILKIFEEIKSTNILLSEVDLNLIEQETNYKTIHDILISIFFFKDKYKETDKNCLLELFKKDKKNILYFIKVLNDHRTKGNFIISEYTLKYLGELFKNINDLALSNNDMDLFKFIFILSMTYYYPSKDKEKIYLFAYIKDHPYYQKGKFWDDYLHELINYDLKGEISNKKIENLKKEEKETLINSYFSNFLTVVKAMADFRMSKKFVRDFVEKNKEKYYLSKEQIENICMIYDVSLKENEANYNGDIINTKIEKNNINDKNKDINKDINKINEKEPNSIDDMNKEIKKEEIVKESENLKENENIKESEKIKESENINKNIISNNNEDLKENKKEQNEAVKKIDENNGNNSIINKNNVIVEESLENEKEDKNNVIVEENPKNENENKNNVIVEESPENKNENKNNEIIEESPENENNQANEETK